MRDRVRGPRARHPGPRPVLRTQPGVTIVMSPVRGAVGRTTPAMVFRPGRSSDSIYETTERGVVTGVAWSQASLAGADGGEPLAQVTASPHRQVVEMPDVIGGEWRAGPVSALCGAGSVRCVPLPDQSECLLGAARSRPVRRPGSVSGGWSGDRRRPGAR